jgi:hypothetical protein
MLPVGSQTVSVTADLAGYSLSGANMQALLRAFNAAAMDQQAGAVAEGMKTLLERMRSVSRWAELNADAWLAAARTNAQEDGKVNLGDGVQAAGIVGALRDGGVYLPVEYRGTAAFTQVAADGGSTSSEAVLDIGQLQTLLAPYETTASPGSGVRTYDIPGIARVERDGAGRLSLRVDDAETGARTGVRIDVQSTTAWAKAADVDAALERMDEVIAEVQRLHGIDLARLSLQVDALGESVVSQERHYGAARRTEESRAEAARDAQAAGDNRAAEARRQAERLQAIRAPSGN